MSLATTRQENVSIFSRFFDTSTYSPADREQHLSVDCLVQAFIQRGDQRITLGLYFIFHGKDLLPLAALLGFGLANSWSQPCWTTRRWMALILGLWEP